jgi:hypothetical protein
MKAFMLFVNGEHLCTAGVGCNGVLTAHVTWVGKPGSDGDLFMSVGGLDSSTDEHVRWKVPNLHVGDEVSILVVERDGIDSEGERYRLDRSEDGESSGEGTNG